MYSWNLIRENIRISIDAIRANLLRSILTISIIAIGIMALVGILTATDSIKNAINSEFARMGANTFTIQSRGMTVQIGKNRKRTKNHDRISYREAKRFVEEFDFPAHVSMFTRATGTATVTYRSEQTDPNITILGADAQHIYTAGLELEKGRNFTPYEVRNGRLMAIIGNNLAKNIFAKNEDPLGKVISAGKGKYKVIGVLKEQGSSLGGYIDRMVMIPVNTLRQDYPNPEMSFRINVKPQHPELIEIATGEAEGLFRIIRGLSLRDESDFNIAQSDNLANLLLENIRYVAILATLIGVITLLGAVVGLTNIMLVSVSERTREIGTRKAIGANSKIIRMQFLFETIIIGQLGGILGILLGIMAGNIVSFIMKAPFVVPWIWIISGFILCFIVGLISGIFPAIKASKLDPIVALRYE